MKSNVKRPVYALALMLAVAFISCERENEFTQGTDEEEEQTLLNAAIADETSDDVLEVAYETESGLTSSSDARKFADCATVTHDAVNKNITVDFGDGCAGPHGRVRSGRMFIQYSSEVGDSLANRVITFSDFFVNNKQVEGKIELRDLSINETGFLQSVKRVEDLKITFPNGEYVVFTGSRTREWLQGRGDGDPANNIYRITGSVEGKSSTGRSFTHEIKVPVIADWTCVAARNFARVAGVVEMTRLGGYKARKRIVNYGEGVCDNAITVTTVRRTYTISVD